MPARSIARNTIALRSLALGAIGLGCLALCCLTAGPARMLSSASAQQPPGTEAPPAATPLEQDAAEHERRVAELEKSLSGAVLVGHFTVSGAEGEPREERYELGEVKHLDGDNWLISARIKYGDHDLTIPLTLPIRWAGDTPIITVDSMAFPGMGTYTARVMIYRDHYAGFWTGADHGGHLYGVLERPEADRDGPKRTAPEVNDKPAGE
ncbi:MAG TPA: hypothetical protein VEQ85_02200 [Lacipirellulaceae bacterium]|nr:hypothetical protein [Lacipirellulaceae bacterium]